MFMRVVLAAIVLPIGAVRVENLQRASNGVEDIADTAEEAQTNPWEGDLLPLLSAGVRQPLLGALVPPDGKTYHFSCAEKFNFLEANEYDWVLDTVEDMSGHREAVNQTVAELRGSWRSSSFGHKRTRAKDAAGTNLFDIRLASSVWNPLQLHWTWRIVVPQTTMMGGGDVLFTAQQDLVGGGLLLDREEWHIYRGHIEDNDKVYYCEASRAGFRYECYHSKRDIAAHRQPAATMYQKTNSATNIQDMWRDTYEVNVREHEDAAVLLAIATVIDMTKDSSASEESDHEGRAETAAEEASEPAE